MFTLIKHRNTKGRRLNSKSLFHIDVDVCICLLTAFVVITICSKSSFLYPLNDWVDANCFFTVGKSMLHGLVPYVDLIEQKGPLLYMIHALAALISYTSFIGVYLIEIVACFLFLLLCRKILKLFFSHSSIFWIPLIATVVYSSTSFAHGDSAEELCLPLLAYTLYCSLKSFKTGKGLTRWQGVFIGVTAACVLWIKYNLLGFYVGWFIAYGIICVYRTIISKRKARPSNSQEENRAQRSKANGLTVWNLIRTGVAIIIGVVIISIPILLYFYLNHGLSELYQIYFYDNLFSYASTEQATTFWEVINNLQQGYQSAWSTSPLALISIFVSVIGLACYGKRKEIFVTALSFAGIFVAVFFSSIRQTYYSLILFVFVPIGIGIVERSTLKMRMRLRSRKYSLQLLSICAVVLSFLFLFIRSDNIYLMGTEKNSMPQYQFADIVLQEENPTLLNYGFLDGGFYTTTGLVPNCRYFCMLNKTDTEMMETQDQYVEEGMVDFIVTRDFTLETDRYTCVSESIFYFEGSNKTYYLYQLTSEIHEDAS